MVCANVPVPECCRVWWMAVKMATLLNGLVTVVHTRFEHLLGANPPFATCLRTWGEPGVVKTKTDATPKLDDRVTCMFAGYATSHAGDCYYLWNPTTTKVYMSRDVVWLKHMFHPDPDLGVTRPQRALGVDEVE